VKRMIIHSKEFLLGGPFALDRIHAPMPVGSISTKRMRCPNCDRPTIAPMVSTYLMEGAVENDWVCSACGFEWSSGFNGFWA
jgi:hypothetical protein